MKIDVSYLACTSRNLSRKLDILKNLFSLFEAIYTREKNNFEK